MYKFLMVLKVVLLVLFILFSFFWFVIHGSSHNIPIKTEIGYGIMDILLAVLTILAFYLDKR